MLLAIVLVALGLPVAVTADTPPQLDVTLNAVTVSGNTPDDTVVVEGTVTNTATVPVHHVKVDLWRSSLTLRTSAQVQVALQSTTAPEGITFPAPDVTASVLQPGASQSFQVTGTLRQLGFNTAASYWVGVNAVGSTQSTGPQQTLGKARTLATVVGQQPTRAITVVELSATPTRLKPNLFLNDSLADELMGRLRTLVNAAAADDASYVLDPALLASVQDMADGYRVVDGTKIRAGKGTEAAQAWLKAVEALPTERSYHTLYARPDLTGLAAAKRPDLLKRAQQATRNTSGQRPLVLLAHRVTPETASFVSDLNAPILSTGLGAGHSWERRSGVNVIGAVQPGAIPLGTALGSSMVARKQAHLALFHATGSEVRVIRTTTDHQLDREHAPTSRTTLGQLMSTPARSGAALPTPPSAAQAHTWEPNPATIAPPKRLDALAASMQLYDAAAPNSTMASHIDAQLCQLISESWRGNETGQRRWVDAITSRYHQTAFDQKLTISVSERVTTSSSEAEFPVTVTNRLDDTVRIRVVGTSSSAQRVTLIASQDVSIAPGDSHTFTVGVRAHSNSTVSASVHVETVDHRRLTKDAPLILETTNLGQLGWVIVIVSGVALVVTTALRIRQVRRRTARTTE